MPELVVRIRGKTASAEGAPCIVCGNADYTVRFLSDTAWDTGRQAHLTYSRGGVRQHTVLPFSGDVCALPALTGTAEAEIGVSAGSPPALCCTPVRIPCVPCITDLPADDRPPSYDLYAALLAAVTERKPFSRQYALLDADGFAVRDAEGFAVTVKG